jgi:elongation factor G
MLYYGGAIDKPEFVESGKTVSDFTEEEVSRKISVHTSLSHLKWKDVKINLLDTPGASDFTGEVLSAFRVAEASLMLVGADSGVQIETLKLWRSMNELSLPRLVFINKMEKEHADFYGVLADLKENFGASFIPIVIPIGEADSFKGIVNLLDQKAYLFESDYKLQTGEIPEEMSEAVSRHRVALMEAAAEGDDDLMEKYLEEETLSDEEILLGIKKALESNQVVPVFAGSALNGSGAEILLDFIAAAVPPPGGHTVASKNGQEIEVPVDPEGAASCFVFKTSIDQFSGKLSYIEVMSGKLTAETDLVNVKQNQKERISKLYTCLGKKIEETNELIAGDIGVLTKLSSVATGDTLAVPGFSAVYSQIPMPQPVHAVAISASSKRDEDKLNTLLQRQMEEDPTFKLVYNSETKENVISSMGELHLSIVLDRIKEKQKIEVQTRIPKVAYRETITRPSAAEYQHKKQTGGHGQYARVSLEIQPLPRGEEFKFTNAVFGGAISRGYIPGVEKGILEGMESGVLAGYPVVDIEAKVVDGKEHPVDSSEMSFKLASRGALKDALENAEPVLLEPMASLVVYVSDQYFGDVLSDLSARRGRVLGQEPMGGGIQAIKALVPQAELLRYSIDLKSITSGTASFEMAFDHYDPITGKIAEDIIKAAKTKKDQGQ